MMTIDDDDVVRFCRLFPHTPGPWVFGINPIVTPEVGVDSPWSKTAVVRTKLNGEWIADLGVPASDHQLAANVRLIAAAPDLLEYVMRQAVRGDFGAKCLIKNIVNAKPEAEAVSAVNAADAARRRGMKVV
jgi:hypothetical protein